MHASNTASNNHARRSIYSNRAVTYNQIKCCDCSITVPRSSCMFYACKWLQLQETIHLLILCATVVDLFCCNGQPLPRALLQCSHLLLQIQRGLFLVISDSLNSKNYMCMWRSFSNVQNIINSLFFKLVNEYIVIECVLCK